MGPGACGRPPKASFWDRFGDDFEGCPARCSVVFCNIIDRNSVQLRGGGTAACHAKDIFTSPPRARRAGIVLFHHDMRVRFTGIIQQPFGMQDVRGIVASFDPDPAEGTLQARLLPRRLNILGNLCFQPFLSRLMDVTTSVCLQARVPYKDNSGIMIHVKHASVLYSLAYS